MNTAKVIAVTQPLLTMNEDIVGSRPLTIDEFVAYVARVSNPTNQNNSLTANKLLKYLVKNKHWSPFELVNIVMEINTPRDIGRQILRHRSFSFQEFSQRYADPTQMGFVTREARLQDMKNRQNSIEVDDEHLSDMWKSHQEAVIYKANEAYKWAIENGIAKEQARAVLPEGLTPTRMYMNGTLRSWIHYCQLRGFETAIDPKTGEKIKGTQKEHREVALSAWAEIVKIFPSLEGILNE